MANWTLSFLDWKDANGLTKRIQAYVSDDATPRFLAGNIIFDSAGNPISSTSLTNGRGLNTVIMNDVPVKGMAAVGDLTAGLLPVFLGGSVGAGIAQRTLVADSRLQQMSFSGDGRLLTLPLGPPEDQGLTTPIVGANDTSSHQLIPAQSASVKIALWGMECVNLSATLTSVIILDATTEIGRIGIPASGGRQAGHFPAPMKGSGATAMNYQLTTSVGANQIYFTPFWYITKE